MHSGEAKVLWGRLMAVRTECGWRRRRSGARTVASWHWCGKHEEAPLWWARGGVAAAGAGGAAGEWREKGGGGLQELGGAW